MTVWQMHTLNSSLAHTTHTQQLAETALRGILRTILHCATYISGCQNPENKNHSNDMNLMVALKDVLFGVGKLYQRNPCVEVAAADPRPDQVRVHRRD
jgi:hypothetical protein